MKQRSLDDVVLLELKAFTEENGSLVPIEDLELPFKDIRRVFYVYNVDDLDKRGNHSHYMGEQVLICVSGEIDIICHDGFREKTYTLNKPNQALYIPEMIWDSQIYKTKDTIMISICNSNYNPKDYILDFEYFKKLKGAL